MKMNENNLFFRTPLLESIHLKDYVNGNKVLLKLENCQPSGSFKMRGISRKCQYVQSKGCEEIISSSGGNAGLATAYSANKLGVKCRIVVPSRTSDKIKEHITKLGANVEVYGDVWNDANERALQLSRELPNRAYVHPFDDPIVWDGHSTMIDEIAAEISETPSLVISCCGGGGLLCGIVEGMRRANWKSVPILAMETIGADSLNAAVKSGGYPVTIPGITSIATCLGSVIVCDQIARYYRESSPPILSHVIEDRDAVDSCIKFANDHQFIVETACGAALAGLYTGLANKIIKESSSKGPVIIIVCGGSGITFDVLNDLKKQFNL